MACPYHFSAPHAMSLLSVAALMGLALLARPARAGKPETLATGERMVILRLPGGTLMGARQPTGSQPQQATARYSHDNGSTWGEPEALFALPGNGGKFAGVEALRVVRAVPVVWLLARSGYNPDALGLSLAFVAAYAVDTAASYGLFGLVMIRGNLARDARRKAAQKLEEIGGGD